MALRYKYFDNIKIGNKSIEERNIFADILWMEEESIVPFLSIEDWMDQYHKSGVLKYFNLNFTDWMELPIKIRDLITENAGKLQKEEVLAMEALENKQ